ncbi:MAG: DMT family transporter [Anaerolineales bacterium]|nr:DMT family transporter [Anaerolineales bacterium]
MLASLAAPIIYAFSAALAWGSGDFVSGLGARRIGAFHTLLLSLPIGALPALAAAYLIGEPLSSSADLMWGIVGGMMGTVGFMAMLHGFAVGRMGVVSPVAGAIGAAVPVLITAIREGMPGQQQLLGFAVALASIWLVSPRGGDKKHSSGLGYGLIAGLGFGLFFTTLDQISETATFWPLAASRLASTLLLAAIAVAARRPLLPGKLPVAILIGSGVLDMLGNFLFLRAVQYGRLDIAAVLISLGPGITVLLARLVEKEHLSRVQVAGVGLALVAIALITT